jgi:hypothetical protein
MKSRIGNYVNNSPTKKRKGVIARSSPLELGIVVLRPNWIWTKASSSAVTLNREKMCFRALSINISGRRDQSMEKEHICSIAGRLVRER